MATNMIRETGITFITKHERKLVEYSSEERNSVIRDISFTNAGMRDMWAIQL